MRLADSPRSLAPRGWPAFGAIARPRFHMEAHASTRRSLPAHQGSPTAAHAAATVSPSARTFEPGTHAADVMMACSKGLQLVPIRQGKSPVASLVVRTQGGTWLLGCSEDSQRALAGQVCVNSSRIDRIFVTSLTPEGLLGLPGMLCTVSSGMQQGHIRSDFPVHVYGPPGIEAWIEYVSERVWGIQGRATIARWH